MHLGAADPGREACPVAEAVQPHTRRIDEVGRIRNGAAQTATGLLHHRREERREHLARPRRVGVGQRRTLRRTGAEVVEARRMAVQPADHLAKARRPRQLAIEQGHELALRGQSAHPKICFMLIDQAIELAPQHMLQNIVEYAILVPHDVDAFRVPKRRQTLETQKNQRHALCPEKLNRTAVGRARP
jgi:hypothetical protein